MNPKALLLIETKLKPIIEFGIDINTFVMYVPD